MQVDRVVQRSKRVARGWIQPRRSVHAEVVAADAIGLETKSVHATLETHPHLAERRRLGALIVAKTRPKAQDEQMTRRQEGRQGHQIPSFRQALPAQVVTDRADRQFHALSRQAAQFFGVPFVSGRPSARVTKRVKHRMTQFLSNGTKCLTNA